MVTGAETPYISREDEAEAEALAALRGTGETIYLDIDEVNNYNLSDFGLGEHDVSR